MRSAVRYAAAGLVLLAILPTAAASPDLTVDTSANWAGYTASARPGRPERFTRVTGSWRVPGVACRPGESSASSAWVGLGGHEPESRALEQIGTDSDCTAAGRATTYAWYELIPALSVRLRLVVRPGDALTASVGLDGSGTKVRLELENRTRGTRFAKEVGFSRVDLASAEWIVEAPSLCGRLTCHPVPLANFGAVRFTRATATLAGHTGAIHDPAWTLTRTRLVPGVDDEVGLGGPRPETGVSSSAAGAAPGVLGPDGRSFRIVWQPNPGL
jgi:hypothetical protein